MTAATPTDEAVIDAVYTVVNAIGSIGTVLKRDHTLEDDVEWLKVNNYLAASMDLWVIYCESSSPFEGKGVGEDYERYNIRIRYWSIRTNDADWQRTAAAKVRSVIDALAGNSAVFGTQLFTPTTVSKDGPYPKQIRDAAREGGQLVYEAILSLTVEARRWTT